MTNGKKRSSVRKTAKSAPRGAVTLRGEAAAAAKVPATKSSKAAVSDPVGSYMREHRGVLGKGYKLSY